MRGAGALVLEKVCGFSETMEKSSTTAFILSSMMSGGFGMDAAEFMASSSAPESKRARPRGKTARKNNLDVNELLFGSIEQIHKRFFSSYVLKPFKLTFIQKSPVNGIRQRDFPEVDRVCSVTFPGEARPPARSCCERDQLPDLFHADAV